MNKSLLNKKMITGAIALLLLPVYTHAESLEAVFPMYDPGNDVINTDTTVVGSIDLSAINSGMIVDGTTPWAVSSSQLFFGINWIAYNGVMYGPGTHSLSLVDSAPCPTGVYTSCATSATAESITVGANQVAGHIKFAWGSTGGIDVVNLWNISYSRTGVATFTNTDLDGDSAPGWGMQDGPFFGFEAVFNLTVEPGISGINITTSQAGNDTSFLLDTANIVINSGHTGAANYEWNLNSDSAITSAATTALTGAGANTLTINPTGLSGPYTVSVNITDGGGNVVRADHGITITPFTMPAGDSDGDETPNASESTNDTDGDGIPDYLDHSGYPMDTTLQTAVTDGTNSSVMVTSAGTIRLGATALQKSFNNITLDNTSTAFGPLLATTDMSADITESSCVGGCFDFEVTGITPAGSSVQVTIPLDVAIPQNPVYRKFDTIASEWVGYELDDNNSIASAPALSSGPTTCPAPGAAAYTSGLTEGHFCVQLTIQDNGPNDADSTDGTIADPGGVASTDQFNTKNVGKVDAVGGGWWFLMGIPALIGLRRFANSK